MVHAAGASSADPLSLPDYRRVVQVLDHVADAATLPELYEQLTEGFGRHLGWHGIILVERPQYLTARTPTTDGGEERYHTRMPRQVVEEFHERWRPYNPFASVRGIRALRAHGVATLSELRPWTTSRHRCFIESFLLPHHMPEMMKILIQPHPHDVATLCIPFPEEHAALVRERAISRKLRRLLTPLFRDPLAASRPPVESLPLTERERHVAELVARGMTNQQIALELDVTIDTVKKHLTHSLTKTSCENRTQLALLWKSPVSESAAGTVPRTGTAPARCQRCHHHL